MSLRMVTDDVRVHLPSENSSASHLMVMASMWGIDCAYWVWFDLNATTTYVGVGRRDCAQVLATIDDIDSAAYASALALASAWAIEAGAAEERG